VALPSNRYGLVTEQKKGAYKYFVDLGDRMEVATVRTVYVDEVSFILHLSAQLSRTRPNVSTYRIDKLRSISPRWSMACHWASLLLWAATRTKARELELKLGLGLGWWRRANEWVPVSFLWRTALPTATTVLLAVFHCWRYQVIPHIRSWTEYALIMSLWSTSEIIKSQSSNC